MASNSSGSTKYIKYFRCLGIRHYASQYPNRRVMIMRNGAIEFEDDDVGDENASETIPLLEDTSDVEYPVDGSALVMMCPLNTQVKEASEQLQRENISTPGT